MPEGLTPDEMAVAAASMPRLRRGILAPPEFLTVA
jgi:hypothetical protein